MTDLFKKITTLLVLASFLTVMFFSFAVMMEGPDGRMQGDCPFSAMGISLCPQDILAVAVHHISSFNSFLNVPVPFGMMSLIVSLVVAFCAILLVSVIPSLFRLPALSFIYYDSPPSTSYSRKITRWLSLFENSPSL